VFQQKTGENLFIGAEQASTLKPMQVNWSRKKEFYSSVRKYYTAACDCML